MKQADEQREAFEAWADDQGFPLKRLDTSDGYLDLRTHGAWEAWQAALAAALPPAAVQAWQPIETAPKDLLWSSTGHNYGERILVYNPVHQEVVRCRWWWSDSGPSNFIADGGLAVFPSHWMPLPASPLAANEGTLTAGKQGGGGVPAVAPPSTAHIRSVPGGAAFLRVAAAHWCPSTAHQCDQGCGDECQRLAPDGVGGTDAPHR